MQNNLYDLIYDFIVTYLFPTDTPTGSQDWALSDFEVTLQNGMSISMQQWICHTITIIAMCLIVVFAIWLVRWVFKAVSSAFLLRR